MSAGRVDPGLRRDGEGAQRPDDGGQRRDSGLGLGFDAGGSRTRWALASGGGELVATGEAAGISAHMLRHSDGRQRVRATLAEMARAAFAHGRPARIEGGVTGLPEDPRELRVLVAETFALAQSAVRLSSDIVFAYRGQFEPGQGYVVYAGTGSVAAFIDAQGNLHRAGGRGALLDDGGGGFWIAREALRHVWRREDEQPGAWKDSAMAREIFARLGGSEWAHTREAVYGGDRGDIGRLALVVAATADADPVARGILEAAGLELARLANAMVGRFGPRPIVLTGRAAELHPLVGESMRKALGEGARLDVRAGEAHVAAAHLAARAAVGSA